MEHGARPADLEQSRSERSRWEGGLQGVHCLHLASGLGGPPMLLRAQADDDGDDEGDDNGD
eukprot:4491500-Alexandrium_andersonii.AAC.1